MAERIDHAAEARKTSEQTLSYGEYSEDTGAIVSMIAAQTHATLALVEQQRIANHIAYVALLEAQYAEAAKHPGEFQWTTRAASESRHGLALDRIREGLGL